MRKLLLSALLLAGSARAEFLNVAVFGGYSTVSFASVNSALKDALAGTTGSVTEGSSGWLGGVDLNFSVFPFVKLGLRADYLSVNQMLLKSKITYFSPPLEYETTFDPSLTSGLVGLTVGTSLPLTGLSISGSVYGGAGVAAVPSSTKLNGTKVWATFLGGTGFVAEGDVKIRYELISLVGFALSLDGQGGYRYASLGVLGDGTNNLAAKIKDKAGNDATFDFSGGFGTLGLTLGF